MKAKTVFSSKKVYWCVVTLLGLSIVSYLFVLAYAVSWSNALHLVWASAVLFLVFTKHENALVNLKWWLIIGLIAGPAFSVAGRFLNEALDNFSSDSAEFYMFRVLSIVVGLIMLNHIRSTVTVEKVEAAN